MLKKSASLFLFMWSVRSVWCVWLYEPHQMDQTDQITRQTWLVPNVLAVEILLDRNSFSAPRYRNFALTRSTIWRAASPEAVVVLSIRRSGLLGAS